MSKRTPRNTLKKRVFRIYRITGKGTRYVDSQIAVDDAAAVQAHVETYKVKDPSDIKRLFARPEQ